MKAKKHVRKFVLLCVSCALVAACGSVDSPVEPATPIEQDSPDVPIDTADTTDATAPDPAPGIIELNLNTDVKGATDHTRDMNNAIYDHLDFGDLREFEKASRGLITAPEHLEIFNAEGELIFSQKAFEFVRDTESPDTANPSLWRHTQLNHNYGLYEVMDGIYQVRGYDLCNFTFVEGDTGWILFDTGSSIETMQAALQLVNEELGERPIMAIIVSHSHGDHYGGLRGIINEDNPSSTNIPIIVPVGFEEFSVSENLYAGAAMFRRAFYQYGFLLPPSGPQSTLAIGLGIENPGGYNSYMGGTDHITYTGETRTIDGVEMVFQMTPGTEAPAEMNTWLPQKKALWMAENCAGTLHNLYTLRGAQVRDGNDWANYLMESITLFGDEVEVIFQAHNWPCWGNEEVHEYMSGQAAVYKFLNDQSLMYINQGYTPEEIAEMITLPDALNLQWHTRPYYGTYKHNAKAVYQRFMGWYDANPAMLDPLPPTESAKKLVEYLGDTDEVLRMAMEDYENGEYRWVAEIMSVLVFADPTNTQARLLGADALEQLGYQAEAGTWRSAYLTGAQELRHGGPPPMAVASSQDIVAAMEPFMVFEYLGIRLDSNAAQDINLRANIILTGDKSYLMTIKHGVVLYQADTTADDADVTITMPLPAVSLLLVPNLGEGSESEQIRQMNELVQIEGDKDAFFAIYPHMVEFASSFNIIEP